MRKGLTPLIFAVTVFGSAWLLFQVQPLIAKYVLPWFGGSPSVWTVCMLFFQSALFLGYSYAHATTRWLPVRAQTVLHGVLLLGSLTVLPITPAAGWKPLGDEDPAWRLVLLLAASIGLPYLLLSASGPLLQAWYSRVEPQRSPYGLYALSNLGSLLALLSYPFLIDGWLGAGLQTRLWSWLFAGLVAAACLTAGLTFWSARRPETPAPAAGTPAVARRRPAFGWWFACAMIPSVMLLATTNQICLDVAPVPFLWILPLTVYLLSFVLCFHSLRWCSRAVWAVAWLVVLPAGVYVLFAARGANSDVSIPVQIAVYVGLLWACAMLCHGELVRLKPEPARLTSFYLTLAAGGACGGLFVGLVAPQVFPTYLELPLAMLGTTGLVLAALFRDPASWFYRGRPRWAWACLAVMTLALVAGLVIQFEQSLQGIHAIQRNFYGVLQVKLEAHNPAQNDYICHLIHGRTLHGLQFTREDRRRLATSYYGPQSGVGLVFAAQPAGIPRRIGLVGLGIGTLAAYGRPGDTFRFYEINPASIRLAREFFLYLDDCPARVEIVPGDARLSLEREAPQQFDLLVLDAFSSDAIPLHLLTREALAIYLRHLQPDGVLAVHISNVYLDLRPVLAGWAAHADLQMATIHSAGQEDDGTRTALWVLLSRSAKALQVPAIQKDQLPPETRRIDWTDDRNSLFEALK